MVGHRTICLMFSGKLSCNNQMLEFSKTHDVAQFFLNFWQRRQFKKSPERQIKRKCSWQSNCSRKAPSFKSISFRKQFDPNCTVQLKMLTIKPLAATCCSRENNSKKSPWRAFQHANKNVCEPLLCRKDTQFQN